MSRRAFSPYPWRRSSSSSTSPRPKDGEDAHAGRDVSGEMSRGMNPAASCRVDDKLSYKLNTSEMKMHYPSASLALRRWTPLNWRKISVPENWKEANGRNEFRDFFVRQRFKRISSRLVRELRKSHESFLSNLRLIMTLTSLFYLWLNHQSSLPDISRNNKTVKDTKSFIRNL